MRRRQVGVTGVSGWEVGEVIVDEEEEDALDEFARVENVGGCC